MLEYDKVIITDCDGVLMNWEYAFHVWMNRRGYTHDPGNLQYDMSHRYDIEKSEMKKLVKAFNESAAIGFLPPLRDAMYYVDLLHRKHGYVFHMVTSLSLDPAAQELRIQNTRKLFGETTFEKFVFADCGADKDEVLEPYTGSGLYWIEDKPENYSLGERLGLNPILMEHGHNMDLPFFNIAKNWKEIYEIITGER